MDILKQENDQLRREREEAAARAREENEAAGRAGVTRTPPSTPQKTAAADADAAQSQNVFVKMGGAVPPGVREDPREPERHAFARHD